MTVVLVLLHERLFSTVPNVVKWAITNVPLESGKREKSQADVSALYGEVAEATTFFSVKKSCKIFAA